MLSFVQDVLRLRHLVIGILAVMLPLSLSVTAVAQSNSAIAQQFRIGEQGITAASLVSLEKDNSNSVVLATVDKSDQLVGVVGSSPLIELSNGESGIQVVTSGTTMALVSDLNGAIFTGDKITVSPISGIGMKAVEGVNVIGTASASLESIKTETREITDKLGKSQTVRIGLIPVQVSAAFYSPTTDSSEFVPAFLQSMANNITGTAVSPMRVLIAALVLLLVLICVAALIYASIRSSIISIGRNPLSESAVRRSLLQVGGTVFGLLLFATIIITLILTV